MPRELNKAERLHEFLSRARNLSGGKVCERFGELLEVDRDSTGELMLALSLMHRTLTEIGEELERIDGKGEGHHQIFLEIVGSVRRTLTPEAWWGGWDQHKTVIRDTDLMAIRSFGVALGKRRTPDAITAEQLAQIGDAVNVLEKSIVECDVDPELKSYLITEIASIRRALLEYRIRGIEALRSVLFEGIGVWAANQEKFKAEIEEKPVREYMNLLFQINNVVTLALHLKALAEPAFEHLRHLGAALGIK